MLAKYLSNSWLRGRNRETKCPTPKQSWWHGILGRGKVRPLGSCHRCLAFWASFNGATGYWDLRLTPHSQDRWHSEGKPITVYCPLNKYFLDTYYDQYLRNPNLQVPNNCHLRRKTIFDVPPPSRVEPPRGDFSSELKETWGLQLTPAKSFFNSKSSFFNLKSRKGSFRRQIWPSDSQGLLPAAPGEQTVTDSLKWDSSFRGVTDINWQQRKTLPVGVERV